jgi:hypothetical protein
MAITIARDDVKRKCMIPTENTSYDSHIDSLISEMQPGIEYTIADVFLNNVSDSALQSTLSLGVLEIISGEFLEQLSREPGASEAFEIAGVTLGERKEKGQLLKAQGQARLAPFLRAAPAMMDDSRVLSTSLDSERHFTFEEQMW